MVVCPVFPDKPICWPATILCPPVFLQVVILAGRIVVMQHNDVVCICAATASPATFGVRFLDSRHHAAARGVNGGTGFHVEIDGVGLTPCVTEAGAITLQHTVAVAVRVRQKVNNLVVMVGFFVADSAASAEAVPATPGVAAMYQGNYLFRFPWLQRFGECRIA